MGEHACRRSAETAAFRAGVELGLMVIDAAEMYGDGATESFLGEALAGLREQVVLTSKASESGRYCRTIFVRDDQDRLRPSVEVLRRFKPILFLSSYLLAEAV